MPLLLLFSLPWNQIPLLNTPSPNIQLTFFWDLEFFFFSFWKKVLTNIIFDILSVLPPFASHFGRGILALCRRSPPSPALPQNKPGCHASCTPERCTPTRLGFRCGTSVDSRGGVPRCACNFKPRALCLNRWSVCGRWYSSNRVPSPGGSDDRCPQPKVPSQKDPQPVSDAADRQGPAHDGAKVCPSSAPTPNSGIPQHTFWCTRLQA